MNLPAAAHRLIDAFRASPRVRAAEEARLQAIRDARRADIRALREAQQALPARQAKLQVIWEEAQRTEAKIREAPNLAMEKTHLAAVAVRDAAEAAVLEPARIEDRIREAALPEIRALVDLARRAKETTRRGLVPFPRQFRGTEGESRYFNLCRQAIQWGEKVALEDYDEAEVRDRATKYVEELSLDRVAEALDGSAA